jgi:hypothetical protein
MTDQRSIMWDANHQLPHHHRTKMMTIDYDDVVNITGKI